MMPLPEQWSLTVRHGDELGSEDHQALQTIRRTLLGMMDHGFITELNTFGGNDQTQWSYAPGTEDGNQVMASLLDVVRAIAPEHWVIYAPIHIWPPDLPCPACGQTSGEPRLGFATTRQLLNELSSRIEIDGHNGGGGLDYRTADLARNQRSDDD